MPESESDKDSSVSQNDSQKPINVMDIEKDDKVTTITLNMKELEQSGKKKKNKVQIFISKKLLN